MKKQTIFLLVLLVSLLTGNAAAQNAGTLDFRGGNATFQQSYPFDYPHGPLLFQGGQPIFNRNVFSTPVYATAGARQYFDGQSQTCRTEIVCYCSNTIYISSLEPFQYLDINIQQANTIELEGYVGRYQCNR